MSQSDLYKRGSGLAQNVDVISDSSRDLGTTDVGDVGSTVTIDTDGEPRLGEVAVHNTVDTDISAALQSTQSDDPLEVLAEITKAVDTDIGAALNNQDTLDINLATAAAAIAIENTVDTDIGAALNADDEVTVHDPAAQNHDSVTSFSHDVSNDMPSNAVPEGVEVQFQADPNNSNTVTVENVVLPAGGTVGLQITNTDVVTTGGTGTINVIYEG